jgi:hypothetical protein
MFHAAAAPPRRALTLRRGVAADVLLPVRSHSTSVRFDASLLHELHANRESRTHAVPTIVKDAMHTEVFSIVPPGA